MNEKFTFVKWLNTKVGGLDLSRRDLDRDLDLDAQKISVSTVSISICLDVETTNLTKYISFLNMFWFHRKKYVNLISS